MKVIRKATMADVNKIFQKMKDSKFASSLRCQKCRVPDE